MSAIILHRTDTTKNMRRFYRLDVQPDRFVHRSGAIGTVACLNWRAYRGFGAGN